MAMPISNDRLSQPSTRRDTAPMPLLAGETREPRDTQAQGLATADKITLLGTAPAFRRAIDLARKVLGGGTAA